MKPKRIILIRHAESLSNANPDAHATIPDYQIPLTEEGREAALIAGMKLMHSLPSDAKVAFYVSPFLRTRQTFEAISKAFVPSNIERVREDPRLREQEWGHLRTAESSDSIDIERKKYGTFFYRIPDGESGADVYDRCTGFLDTFYRDIEKFHFPDNVVIVTHGFTMRVLLMRWLHWSVEEFHALKNPRNLEICELNLYGDGKYRLEQPFPKTNDSIQQRPS